MTIPELLKSSKIIAVVGISDDPDRPSYGVAKRLMQAGYTVVPVNPRYKEWEGLACYPYVSSIPESINIDIVDVFRRSEATPDTVRDALKRENKPRCIWLQLGIRNEEARHLTEDAGIFFVEDHCTAVEVALARVRV
jgi:predicted CoA-binding protein